MSKIGYRGEDKGYTLSEEGFDEGLKDILASLKYHRPVLVDMFVRSLDHAVLLTGYNRKAHQLFFLDPNGISPYFQSFTYLQFEQNWHSVVANVRGEIFTSPKD